MDPRIDRWVGHSLVTTLAKLSFFALTFIVLSWLTREKTWVQRKVSLRLRLRPPPISEPYPFKVQKKIPGKSRLLEPPRNQSPVSRKKPRLLFGWRLDNFHYYSFKILLRFWLAKSTSIIQLNQLLMTKFGRILRFMNRWRQKCLNYGWIRKRAIWSESCDLIGYPIGQDWPSCSLGISRVCPARKSSLFVDIANPLLTNREVKMAGYWPQFLDLFRLCQ